ncbi:MAG: hypothetical protein ACW96X_11070 [Promethearchaeota archaeon]
MFPDQPTEPTPERAATNLRARTGGNFVRQFLTSSRYLKLLMTGAALYPFSFKKSAATLAYI